MPPRAWGIASSVLRDVCHGRYDSPFDFGEVGFLVSPPRPDIGVDLDGAALEDIPERVSGDA